MAISLAAEQRFAAHGVAVRSTGEAIQPLRKAIRSMYMHLQQDISVMCQSLL